ncbi:MAG: DsrE family protein [Fibrobacteria bacterium]|nr:DsrE family protein [Fibrobacteria bacterium]
MNKKLGICVSSKNSLQHLVGLTKAAITKGIHTDFFFTGDGVYLTQTQEFAFLLQNAGRIGICEYSYVSMGYKKEDIPSLHDKDFVTQMRNAWLLEHCDRYLIF